jgi:hypothetical protein
MSGRPGEDEEENEDEDMGVAETYADYMPAKCKFCVYHYYEKCNLLMF